MKIDQVLNTETQRDDDADHCCNNRIKIQNGGQAIKHHGGGIADLHQWLHCPGSRQQVVRFRQDPARVRTWWNLGFSGRPSSLEYYNRSRAICGKIDSQSRRRFAAVIHEYAAGQQQQTQSTDDEDENLGITAWKGHLEKTDRSIVFHVPRIYKQQAQGRPSQRGTANIGADSKYEFQLAEQKQGLVQP